MTNPTADEMLDWIVQHKAAIAKSILTKLWCVRWLEGSAHHANDATDLRAAIRDAMEREEAGG